MEAGAFQEFKGDEGILSSSYGDKNTVVVWAEGEFRRWLFCRDREANEVLKVDVIFVEEFTEPTLVDLVPELCLGLCESAGTDDNLFWTARFVVTDTADQVEGEEGTVEETVGQISHVDAPVWERELFYAFHIITGGGSSREEVAERDFRIFPVKCVGVEDEGFVGFHVISMIGLG